MFPQSLDPPAYRLIIVEALFQILFVTIQRLALSCFERLSVQHSFFIDGRPYIASITGRIRKVITHTLTKL